MLKHRLIKLQLKNGKFIKRWNVKFDELKNYKNAYMSVSRWLNPKGVEQKDGLMKVIIDSEILIDFDDANKNQVLSVYRYMKKNHKEYTNTQIVRTSQKGIHLVYKLKEPPIIKKPLERIEFYTKEKIRIAKSLKRKHNGKRFKGIDFPILLDLYRVRRIPGSYNGNKGFKAYLCNDINASVIGLKPKMKRILSRNMIGKEATRSKFPSFFKFISNKVNGLPNMYIIHIKVRDIEQLKDVCAMYNIRHYVLRKDNKFIELISPKIVDYKRMVKMLRYCKANNLNSFLKYKHSWIRVSSTIDMDGKEIEKKPKLVSFVENNEISSYSKFHSGLLENYGVIPTGKLVGEKNKVLIAKVGN